MKNYRKDSKSLLVFILAIILVFQSGFIVNAGSAESAEKPSIDDINVGYTTIEFSFSHQTETDFEVKMLDAHHGGNIVLNWTDASNGTTSSSYIFTDLLPNSDYEIKVRVMGNNKISEESDETTLDLPEIAITSIIPAKRSAEFNWSYDYEADSYMIKIFNEDPENFNDIVLDWTDVGNLTTYTVDNLKDDNPYEFKVKAIKNGEAIENSETFEDFRTLELESFTIKLINIEAIDDAPEGYTLEFINASYEYQALAARWYEVPNVPLDHFEVTPVGAANIEVNGNKFILKDLTDNVTIEAVYPEREFLNESDFDEAVHLSGNARELAPMALDKSSPNPVLSDFTDILFSQDSNGSVEVDIILDDSIANGSLSLDDVPLGVSRKVIAKANPGYAFAGFKYVIVQNLEDAYDKKASDAPSIEVAPDLFSYSFDDLALSPEMNSGQKKKYIPYDGPEKSYNRNRHRVDYMEDVFELNDMVNGEELTLTIDRRVDYDGAAHLEAEFIVYVTAEFYNVLITPTIYERIDGEIIESPDARAGSLGIRSGEAVSETEFTVDEVIAENSTGGQYQRLLDPGTDLQFEAFANVHYEFIGWKADLMNEISLEDGKGNPRTKEVLIKDTVNRFSPSPVFERIEYNLDLIVDQPGFIEDSNPQLAGQGVQEFEETIYGFFGSDNVAFTGELFSGKVKSGDPFMVEPAALEGYLYTVYVWDYLVQQYSESQDEESKIQILQPMMGWRELYSQRDVGKPLGDILLGPSLENRRDMSGNMTKDMKYMILYNPLSYIVEVLVHPDSVGRGSVSQAPITEDNVYLRDDQISVQASANSGQRFVKWWGEFEVELEEDYTNGGRVEAIEDRPFEPVYELVPIKDINSASDIFIVDGWIESNLSEETQKMYPLEEDYPELPVRLYAEFETIPTRTTPTNPNRYSLLVTSTEGGSVSGEGNTSYASITNVVITITPDEGYEFVEWTGDTEILTGNVARVDGDYAIEAVFALIIEEEAVAEEIIEPEEEAIPEEVVEVEEVLLDEATAEETPETMPDTGGVPIEVFNLLGIILTGFGIRLRKHN